MHALPFCLFLFAFFLCPKFIDHPLATLTWAGGGGGGEGGLWLTRKRKVERKSVLLITQPREGFLSFFWRENEREKDDDDADEGGKGN